MLLTPFRTLADPEIQGEGSIDALGLAPLADRLAEWMLPGLTARMWRPRFVTAIAVSSVLTESFEDQIASDHVTPPWLVLEWYYVAAVARLSDAGEPALRRVPGIEKARRAARDGLPLNADRYLKTAKVFGFHGVYKRLARHMALVDDDLALGEEGYRLVRVWEEEQGLHGFSDPDRSTGDGPQRRRAIREAIQDALRAGHTRRDEAWIGAEFFARHLLPNRMGRQEGKFLWERLLDPAAERRGEVFRLLDDGGERSRFAADRSERAVIGRLRERMSKDLQGRADAIEGYEAVCRPLQEAWDRLCFLSTEARLKVLRVTDAAKDERLRQIAGALRGAIGQARTALAESSCARELEGVIARFDGLNDAGELFEALWDRHVDVQRRKPPAGKRPWFERASDGGLIVRPPYRLHYVPQRKEYVHPYRLIATASFVDDLLGAT
jgi:hypothetical protein